jgi:transposase
MTGLDDEPRSGRPRQVDHDAIITATLTPPPKKLGVTHWSSRLLAAHVKIGNATVARAWRDYGVQPWRSQTFKFSTDPELVAKVTDVVGLYLAPPENAVVLCVDEKSQIQALDRTAPMLPMQPGLPERRTHDYRRHGTTTLFAALEIATGKVTAATRPRHRHREFLRFLKQVAKAYPDRELHLVMDNYAAHKHVEVRRWLEANPRVRVHFTPTSASWLNLVEVWFGIIERQAIHRGTFRSVKELNAKIRTFIDGWNDRCHPFVWTKTPDQSWRKPTVRTLQKRATSWLYLGDELDIHQLVRGRQARCADLSLGGRVAESLRANADDRLPLAALGRAQGGDGVVEGRDVADVGPQPSVPHPLDDLTQLATIGLDNEVDRQAIVGPRFGRPDDGHQCSSGSNQACGPLLDVAADDIENQIDSAYVFQRVVLKVDELHCAEVECLLTVGSATGTDDIRASLTRELRHHRPDCAGRAVREDALPRLKAAVLEQSLPRGQARDRQARAHREVDVARQRREIARLHGHMLRQGAVAMPVREAEHPLSHRQPRRAIAEGGDHSGQLVPRDRRRSVTADAIGPSRRPRQLSRDESRRMNLNDDVAYRCRRIGPLHQRHPGRSRSLVRHHNRLHRAPPCISPRLHGIVQPPVLAATDPGVLPAASGSQ